MFTLAHLSDVHLAPLPRPRWDQLFGKRLLGYMNWQKRRIQYSRAFLDPLMADLAEQRPDHIAITGDLVNIALPEEFRLAQAWLESVGPTDSVTVVPGNHDAYVRLGRDPGFRRWYEYMQCNAAGHGIAAAAVSGFPFVRRFGDIALIGLSSAIPTLPLLGSGRLGSAQLAQLGPVLGTLGEEQVCRVILIHHPPLPGMSPWRHGLHDAHGVQVQLMRHGAELILHGHAHADSLASLQTPHGTVFVVGVAAASSAFPEAGLRARYNLLTFQQANSGWRIHMRSRALGENRQPVETDHGILALTPQP